MRADSSAYVGIPITATPAGVDLSLDTFDMAFATHKNQVLAPGDWHPAIWDAAKGVVKMLVGPAGVVIAPGAWIVVVRIHDSPEVPAIDAPGTFKIEALTA